MIRVSGHNWKENHDSDESQSQSTSYVRTGKRTVSNSHPHASSTHIGSLVEPDSEQIRINDRQFACRKVWSQERRSIDTTF